MEKYEKAAPVYTTYDVQLEGINTKLDYIGLKIDENCKNLTDYMKESKATNKELNQRINDVEDSLLEFVPRSALTERINLLKVTIPDKAEVMKAVEESKNLSKICIGGIVTLAFIYVSTYIAHIMWFSR